MTRPGELVRPRRGCPLGGRAEPGLRGRFERKREARAAAHRRIDPNSPAVARDDAAHDREPDARAFEVRRLVEALEWLEQARREARVEADAVVLDEVDGLLAAHDAHLDARTGALPRELPGVAQQILEGDLQEPRVSARLERRGDDEL